MKWVYQVYIIHLEKAQSANKLRCGAGSLQEERVWRGAIAGQQLTSLSQTRRLIRENATPTNTILFYQVSQVKRFLSAYALSITDAFL